MSAERGNLLLEMRRYSEAASAFQAALAEGPDDIALLCGLAEAQALAGDPNGAMQTAMRAVEIAPDLAVSHLLMAWLLRRLGRLEDAKRSAIQALELAPDEVSAHTQLAAIYLQLGFPGDAFTFIAKAMAVEPLDIGLLQMKAAALHMLGDAVQFEQTVSTIARLDPDSSTTQTLIGDQRSWSRKFEASHTAYREALSANPLNPTSLEQLRFTFVARSKPLTWLNTRCGLYSREGTRRVYVLAAGLAGIGVLMCLLELLVIQTRRGVGLTMFGLVVIGFAVVFAITPVAVHLPTSALFKRHLKRR